MSRRDVLAGGSLVTLVLLVMACGSGKERSFDTDVASAAPAEGGPAPGSQEAGAGEGGGGGRPGVGYPAGSCSPLTCKSGCCGGDGKCLPGTAPAQCGKGGLTCMACSAIGYGCVDQGCNAKATCTGCDGCCKAGTCNTNGKTQDNACGRGGAVCKDCTSSSQTCDGSGNCR